MPVLQRLLSTSRVPRYSDSRSGILSLTMIRYGSPSALRLCSLTSVASSRCSAATEGDCEFIFSVVNWGTRGRAVSVFLGRGSRFACTWPWSAGGVFVAFAAEEDVLAPQPLTNRHSTRREQSPVDHGLSSPPESASLRCRVLHAALGCACVEFMIIHM